MASTPSQAVYILIHRSADISSADLSSAATSTTDTNRMAQTDWTTIFRDEATDLGQGDSWHLEFDDTVQPKSPKLGWKEYIRNTGARSVSWTAVYKVFYD